MDGRPQMKSPHEMGQTQKVAAVRFLSPDKVEIVTSACRSAGSGTAPAHTPRYLEQNAVDGGGRRQPARFSALIRLTSKRGEEAGRRRRKCVCLSCRVSSCLPELRGLQSSSAGVTQASDDSSQDYRFFTMHSQSRQTCPRLPTPTKRAAVRGFC